MKYSIDVTINVTDVDEPNFAPVFTEGTSTTRSVAENPASGHNLGAAVTATDANMSDTLTYTLGGTDAADFGIVPSSGQLQTSAALGFETKDSYAVTVSVSDGNGGVDSIDVTINVTADRAARGGALQRDRRSELDERHELVEQRGPLGMAQSRNGRGRPRHGSASRRE